jgi:hypothetical protein
MRGLVALPLLFAALVGSTTLAQRRSTTSSGTSVPSVDTGAGLPPWAAASGWETDRARLCRGLSELASDGRAVSEEQIDACTAEATQRLAQRRETAKTLRVSELEQIPEEYLIAEERQRLETLRAARDESRAATETRNADPRWVGPALSVAFCSYAQMKRDALAAKRLTPSDRRDLDRRVSDYDRSMRTIRATLNFARGKLLACDQPLVIQIGHCLHADAACGDKARQYISLVPRVFP